MGPYAITPQNQVHVMQAAMNLSACDAGRHFEYIVNTEKKNGDLSASIVICAGISLNVAGMLLAPIAMYR